ncbi:MAG: homoserine kinase, partial [Oceanicaulis sp.]
ASAVAGAAAANALLDAPFDTAALLPFALKGESVSADPPPWDNVMASLLGGLVIAARLETALIRPLPVPAGLQAILIHPDAEIETRAARGVLKAQIPLHTAVEHSRRISAFTLGCATGDRELLRAGLEDILIEPQRRFLLPELPDVKRAALAAGAIGCSFSGSGPSVFAWAEDGDADAVETAMLVAFRRAERKARAYRAPPDSAGVRLEPVHEAAAP